MICDLCDKDQQNICERTFHFIKPINECLMRKAQENRQIIEELEKIREEISMTNGCGDFIATYDIQKLIDNHISKLKGENK